MKPLAIHRTQEKWETRFSWLESRRLEEEDTPAYSARRRNRRFRLELRRRNLFAWSICRSQPYRDFVLRTLIQPEEGNGYCAAGCVFRYSDEENFYYFLVSSRGAFRLDVVANGHPLRLIEWTEAPEQDSREIDLQVVAHGAHFSFYLAGEWVAEVEDETLYDGLVGLAAQNYDESDQARVSFAELSLDSRPAAVERAWLRWTRYIPADPACRLRLGRTFFDMGRYSQAAVQLRKGLREGGGGAPDRYLLGETYLRLGLREEALLEIERCLELDPGHGEAALEKANLLYLLNRTLEARDYARSIRERFPESAMLANLLGNAEYALGNWSAALDSYEAARKLDPENPFFPMHAARSMERLARPQEAIAAYLESGRRFFRQAAYDDLSRLIARLRELDPENQEAQAWEAKILFHEGRRAEAGELLAGLVARDCQDSAVHFLYGLILSDEGDRKEAIRHLERACRLEPDCALYWLRLAENRRLLGEDPRADLEQAWRLDAEDPWVNNLQGVLRLEEGDLEAAAGFLERAWRAAPGETDILINYTELLDRQGEGEQALRILGAGIEAAPDRAALYNHRANLLARAGRQAEALADYEQAVRLERDDPRYLENCAACCIELDMILRAEELLSRVLEIAPTASAYNRMGNLAFLKREYRRAELAYQEGLRLAPEDRGIRINLAALRLERGDYEQASAEVRRVLAEEPDHPLARGLLERLRRGYEIRYACDTCGREWWAPRNVPPQPSLRVRGEPPGEAPAGECGACGRVYCVRCASEHLQDQRFICRHCGELLRFRDERLSYLLRASLEEEAVGGEPDGSAGSA